jgi:hypothetical protein
VLLRHGLGEELDVGLKSRVVNDLTFSGQAKL